jgi:integrase
MAKRKRRGNGEGSIFQRADERWTATITIGHDANGKRRRRTVYGKTRGEVQEKLTRLQNQKLDGTLRAVDRETLGDFLDCWLRDVILPDRADNTYASYRLVVERHVKPHIGGVRLDRLNPACVQGMLSSLQRAGVGDRTRQNVYVVLKAALTLALKWGKVSRNACDGVDKPRAVKRDMRPLSANEARQLLAATRDDRFHALFALALSTGMRQGELFGLSWDDVDLVVGSLRVTRQLIEVSGNLKLTPPKTKRSRRTLELTDATVDALVDHRAQMLREGHVAADTVFCDSRGGLLRKSNFRNHIWIPTLKAVPISYRGFHNLRHTYATLTLGAGVPVHVVSAVLGHANASTTLNTYAHILDGMQSAARDKIGGILELQTA